MDRIEEVYLSTMTTARTGVLGSMRCFGACDVAIIGVMIHDLTNDPIELETGSAAPGDDDGYFSCPDWRLGRLISCPLPGGESMSPL
jgi:hypothetical protein